MTITSRRAVLAGALSIAPAVALAAVPDLQPDPVYAAIDRHRAAWALWGEACDLCDHVQSGIWKQAGKIARAKVEGLAEFCARHPKMVSKLDQNRAFEGHRERACEQLESESPEYQAAYAEADAAGKVEMLAARALVETVPATAAGAAALIEYVLSNCFLLSAVSEDARGRLATAALRTLGEFLGRGRTERPCESQAI